MAKKKQFEGPPPTQTSLVESLPSPPPQKFTNYLATYSKSWIYAAVTIIAQEVAGRLKLKLYKKQAGGPKEIEEHEVLSLLHEVNPYMTFYQLVELTEIYQDLVGEAYWGLIRNEGTGKITQIWPLRPDWIYIKGSKEKFIDHYVYRPAGFGEGMKIPPEDIIPFKNPNPLNPYRGHGPVKSAAMAIDIDEYAADWNKAFFFNSCIPSIIFTTEKKLNKAEIKRFIQDWQDKYKGSKQAAKIAFLGGNLKYNEVGANIEKFQLIEIRDKMRDEMLATFGVSKANIGIIEDVNRANQEASDLRLLKKVIQPRIVRLTAHLNEFLLPNWKEPLFFDYVDPIPEDVELKLKLVENGMKNHWLTPNEARAEFGYDPVKGGEYIYIPLMIQPTIGPTKGLEKLLGRKEEKQESFVSLKAKKKKKEKKFNMPIPPKRLRELHVEAQKKEIKKKIMPDLLKMVQQIMLIKEFPEDSKEAYWRAKIAKTDVWEDKEKEILWKLFGEQEKEVVDKLELGKSMTKGVDDWLIDPKVETRKWKGTFEPVVRNIVEERGRDSLQFVGINASLDMTGKRVIEFMEKEALAFIWDVNVKTRGDLKKSLAEGVKLGEGIPDLKKRITGIFDDCKTYRAERIARTETARATMFATDEAYRQSGVVEKREWLVAFDERTCPDCNALSGKRILFGKKFKSPAGDVERPPLHVNCRCDLLPIIEEKSIRKAKKTEAELNAKEYKKDLKAEAKAEVEEFKAEQKEKIKLETEEGKTKEVKKAKEKAGAIVETAVEKAEEEKKSIIGELGKLRDKARDALNGNE